LLQPLLLLLLPFQQRLLLLLLLLLPFQQRLLLLLLLLRVPTMLLLLARLASPRSKVRTRRGNFQQHRRPNIPLLRPDTC
jgi:hypothetical protein